MKKIDSQMIGEIAIAGGIVAFIIVLYIRYENWVKAAPKPIADPERSKFESAIEFRLYDELKARGEYIRTQVPCGRYSIDIALPAYHLAHECDGKEYPLHTTAKSPRQAKIAYLRANEWKVLRFSGRRINRDLGGILVRIEKAKGSGETDND